MSDADGEQKRAHKRVSIVLRGSIIDNGDETKVIINDLSRGGAKLRVAEGTGPKSISFTLKINNIGELDAKLCWRKDDLMGVQFEEGSTEVFKRAAAYITSLPVAPWAAR